MQQSTPVQQPPHSDDEDASVIYLKTVADQSPNKSPRGAKVECATQTNVETPNSSQLKQLLSKRRRQRKSKVKPANRQPCKKNELAARWIKQWETASETPSMQLEDSDDDILSTIPGQQDAEGAAPRIKTEQPTTPVQTENSNEATGHVALKSPPADHAPNAATATNAARPPLTANELISLRETSRRPTRKPDWYGNNTMALIDPADASDQVSRTSTIPLD